MEIGAVSDSVSDVDTTQLGAAAVIISVSCMAHSLFLNNMFLCAAAARCTSYNRMCVVILHKASVSTAWLIHNAA